MLAGGSFKNEQNDKNMNKLETVWEFRCPNHQRWISGQGNRCGPYFELLKPVLMRSVFLRPNWGSNKSQFLTI